MFDTNRKAILLNKVVILLNNAYKNHIIDMHFAKLLHLRLMAESHNYDITSLFNGH